MICTNWSIFILAIKVKFNFDSKSVHTLFYKQHNIIKDQKDVSKPCERTLFVLNVPIYCTKEALKCVFTCFGKVEEVYLKSMTSNNNDEQIKSYFATKAEDLDCFKAGYIVFNMTNSICKSLNQPINEIKILSTKDKPIQTGIKSNKYFILIFQLLFIP